MSVSVEKKPFGVTKDGEAVNVYCIGNEALAVEIWNSFSARAGEASARRLNTSAGMRKI